VSVQVFAKQFDEVRREGVVRASGLQQAAPWKNDPSLSNWLNGPWAGLSASTLVEADLGFKGYRVSHKITDALRKCQGVK
jgi:hypothetical protein